MYNWIETTFNVGEGIAQGLALIISLTVVLVLFGLFVFIIKRLLGANTNQGRSRQPRIAIMDSTTVDTRRRLLLVRRDNVEHLILVGGTSDVVIEQNIVRHAPPMAQGQLRAGAHGAPLPATSGVKSPTAPGPDIPVTPEDIAGPKTQTAGIVAPHLSSSNQTDLTAAARPLHSNEKKSTPATGAFDTKPKSAENRFLSGETAPAPKTNSAAKQNPAAELVRAVKKNGTEPASLSAPPPSTLEQPDPAPEMPGVKPASSSVTLASTSGTRVAEKAGAAFKSLGKSFSPKDRPSYGNQKITPPASGPAARAKTALVKPVEADATAAKVEPTLSGLETASGDLKTESSHEPSISASLSEVKPLEPAAEAGTLGNKSSSSTFPTPELEASLLATFAEERTTPTSGEKTPEVPKASEEKTVEDVAGSAADAQIETTENSDQQPDPDGLGDRNPIEEEMAKILDEVGGQSKS